MDKQFDELSKSLAEGVSRREALRRFGFALAGLAILCLAAAARPAAAQTYTITALGCRAANAINAFGQVACGVGSNTGPVLDNIGAYPFVDHAFLWTPAIPNGTSGSLQDLGTLSHRASSAAYGINDAGQVVGSSWTYEVTISRTGKVTYKTVSPHAFLWQNGGITDLGTLGGSFSEAYAINNMSQIIGRAATNTIGGGGLEVFHAFLWQKGVMADIGAFSGNNSSWAYAINEAGQLAGGAGNNQQSIPSRAGRWQIGAWTDVSEGAAYAVNGLRQVVGYGYFPSDWSYRHAFLWQNGTLLDLGTYGRQSRARGINGSGQVVGDSDSFFQANYGSGGAFLWDSVHGMRDLNTLIPANSGWVLFSANAINDKGQIVGEGNKGAFLLTPQ